MTHVPHVTITHVTRNNDSWYIQNESCHTHSQKQRLHICPHFNLPRTRKSHVTHDNESWYTQNEACYLRSSSSISRQTCACTRQRMRMSHFTQWPTDGGDRRFNNYNGQSVLVPITDLPCSALFSGTETTWEIMTFALVLFPISSMIGTCRGTPNTSHVTHSPKQRLHTDSRPHKTRTRMSHVTHDN